MKEISLLVKTEALSRFTTLLQNGIYLEAGQGETLGGLLAILPGFTEEYIGRKVQTIFLNGLPADDLQQQLFGTEAVIALSAAMPGLAGAIFRKDGVHASLRTETAAKLSGTHSKDQPIKIRLKLFNIIAMERGEKILADGCVVLASALENFFTYRPPLLTGIRKIMANDIPVNARELALILHTDTMIQLTVKDSYGS